MKISRFRIVCFESASTVEKLLLDDKTEVAIALPSSNKDIWAISDLNGKNVA